MNDTNIPEMKTLESLMDELLQKGYKQDYRVSRNGLKALKTGKIYPVDEVKVVNFYRFGRTRDQESETILYVIETKDGGKGTLIDAFGSSSDPLVVGFMKKVEEYHNR